MLAAHTVEMFSKVPENLKYKAGDTIFQEGEPGQVMYGIISGTVELHVNGQVVETIEAGDVFGEGALVQLDGLRRSTAIAKTDCQLAVLDEERFKFLVETAPTFALEVMRSYSNRLGHFKHPQTV